MLDSSAPARSETLPCGLCGKPFQRNETVVRGMLHFCQPCAQNLAAQANAAPQSGGGGLRGMMIVAVAALAIGAGGAWWYAHRAAEKPAPAEQTETTAAAKLETPPATPVAEAKPAESEAARPEEKPAPAKPAEETRRSVADASNIHLLFVTAPGTDSAMGLASRLYVTREEPGRDSATLVTSVGKDMKTSFDEGLRYVRKLPRAWEKDFSIRLSFEDKFTPKDGGSAGTGFTIAMMAAIEGIQLDPSLAVTGDLTVDGSVQPVGAVVEKLRGAIAGKCAITLVPERNAEDVEDLALLDGTSPLWEMQVFSIGTIDQALGLARQDRAEPVKAAIEKFRALRARLPVKVTPNFLASPIVQTELKAIVQLAPNHLSAATLLAAAEKRLSKELSLQRSLDEVMSASYLFVQAAIATVKPPPTGGANKGGISTFPEREYSQCIKRLYELSPILDSRAQELKTACITYAGAARAVATYKVEDINNIRSREQLYAVAQREGNYIREHQAELEAARSRLLLTIRKVGTDTDLRRAMTK